MSVPRNTSCRRDFRELDSFFIYKIYCSVISIMAVFTFVNTHISYGTYLCPNVILQPRSISWFFLYNFPSLSVRCSSRYLYSIYLNNIFSRSHI